MRGLIDSGHEHADLFERLFDFREWLIELRENNANRQHVRRDGNTRTRSDGTFVMGPFTLNVRMRILHQLEALERDLGLPLISESERDVIDDIWRQDRVRMDCREALRGVYAAELKPATI